MLKGQWLSSLAYRSLSGSCLSRQAFNTRHSVASARLVRRGSTLDAAGDAAATPDDSSSSSSSSRRRNRRGGNQSSQRGRSGSQQGTASAPSHPVPPQQPPQEPARRGLHNAAAAASDEQPSSNAAVVVPPLAECVPVPSRNEPQFPDAPFTLRLYQREAIAKVIEVWKSGNNAQMVMLPTGCGKTVVFAALARYLSKHYQPPPAPSPLPAITATALDSSTQPTSSAAVDYGDSGLQGSMLQRGDSTVAAAAASAGGSSPQLEPADDPVAGAGKGKGKRKKKSSASAATSSTVSSSSSAVDSLPAEESSSSSSSAQPAGHNRLLTLLDTLGQQQPAAATAARTPANKGAASTRSQDRIGSSAATSIRNTTSSSSSSLSPTSSEEDTTSSSTSSSSSTSNTSRSSSKAGSSPGRATKSRKQQQQEEQAALTAPPGSMRVLVLAHRHELLRQAEDKFRLMYGAEDVTVSWVKGTRKEFSGQVVVASVATAINCIPSLKECNFSLVIVDEAHHTVASTYTTILEGLGLIEILPPEPAQADDDMPAQQQADSSSSFATSATSSANSLDSLDSDGASSSSSFDEGDASSSSSTTTSTTSDSATSSRADSPSNNTAQLPRPRIKVVPSKHQLLLGFTATPFRLKKKESRALYDVFMPTFVRSMPQMISEGYLCEVRGEKVLTETDLKGALTGNSGDFIASKLSPLVNSRTRNKLVLAAYLEHCTEEVTAGDAAEPSSSTQSELWQQHEQHSSARAVAVQAALQVKARRTAAKKEAQQAAGTITITTPTDSDEDGEGGEEGEEEETESHIYPLPASVSPQSLTGGLSMSGRRPVRKTIAFAVDIKHAEAMNAVFNAAGVRASAIHSMMPYDIMRGELTRFRRGELDVLFNVEVLTEGFDEPAIDAILMARPTRSTGLYTQMLGRGLRIFPSKKDCLVLDFTDKYHTAGKVVDIRVVLPDQFKQAPAELPAKKGPSRVEDGAEGGKIEMLDRALHPQDLAWQDQGEHCVTSIFSGGNVWLCNVGGMGTVQLAELGIVVGDRAAAASGREATAVAGDGQEEQQQVPPWGVVADTAGWDSQDGGGGGGDIDDEDGDAADLQDRYVVLHQENTNDPDPMNWRVAYKPDGHSWRGLTKEDAYGAALDYMESYVRQEQVRMVRRQMAFARGGRSFVPSLKSFTQGAKWRTQEATPKQLEKLKQMEIPVHPGLTKGEASDLISRSFTALASREQVQQLQSLMGAKAFGELPSPLLKAHAADVLKHCASG